eukprot:TRINITY_DN5787_c0_g2_i1.p1 TRINITY_DN5787_c0_g2~~TRINITY_DN5787_c0_g2_i1.p1  ORF type:complete len:443 (+),score=105.42 TRINITY_DN5787_c0_g2_i1:134-1462(+)
MRQPFHVVVNLSLLPLRLALRVDEDEAAPEVQPPPAPVEFSVQLKTPLSADELISCPHKMHAPIPFPYEFGWEVNIGVPHAYYLHKCGKLLHTVSCNISLAAYYWFSPSHRIVTCGPVAAFYAARNMKFEGVGVDDYLRNRPMPFWVRPPHKEFYTSMPVSLRNATAKPCDAPPLLSLAEARKMPLRNPFTGEDFSRYALPTNYMPLKWPSRGHTGIAILNKQHHDWEEKEKGFLDADILRQLLMHFKQACPNTELMYYRNWAFVHDEAGTIAEGTVDSKDLTESDALSSNAKVVSLKNIAERNTGSTQAAFHNVPGLLQEASQSSSALSEAEVASLNSRATSIETHAERNEGMSIAEVQMRVLSRFNCFIGVHGGNTELAVNFGGKMLLFLHGLPWYDKPETLARLHGIAGTKLTVVRNYQELMARLPELAQEGCSKCPLL